MRFWFILLLLLTAAPANAQSDDPAALTDQFNELIPPLLEGNSIPGAAVALIHGGDVVWSAGYGEADLATGTPMTPDTPFNVASISKAFTAWEIMRLVEAGELDLDAPANQYLTSWQIPAVGNKDTNEATLRRILSHTAGLTVEGYAAYEAGAELPTLVDFLNGEAAGVDPVQMLTTAGRRFSYSGGGYTALQLMLEDLTGKPFAQLMQDDLFTPLGMAHSSFAWSPELEAASDYSFDGSLNTSVVHMDQAAGGLYASANDLATFFTTGMSAEYLTPESVLTMQSAAPATSDGYGLGYFVETLADGTTFVWHDGIGWGARTLFILLPESGDGLILLTNTRSGNVLFEPLVCAWDTWIHGEETNLCKAY